MMPPEIRRQIDELRASDLPEAELRVRYADAIQYIADRVDLAQVMMDFGVDLRPISPDSTGVLVGECPNCGHRSLMV